MNKEDKKLEQNKITLIVATLVMTFACISNLFLKSSINDTMFFRYVTFDEQGLYLGLIGSIIFYIFIWLLVSSLFCISLLFCLRFVYWWLHRSDKDISFFDIFKDSELGEDYNYVAHFAFKTTFILMFIIGILVVSNAITISL
ncbi:MAG: hypothetical protein E7235_01030 [Lachnospiraceae bacterium]|nr:hypothetical protein [Lachnospiraceae bacterium]